MSSARRLALTGAVALCATALAAAEGTTIPKGASDDGPPTYTNVQVVAVDVSGRTLVIRNAEGVEEKVQLDDALSGFGDIKAGDRVILTLRRGPGWARVSSIDKSRAVPAPKIVANSPPSPPVLPVDDSEVLAARRAFGAQVASLAGQADRVDRVWKEFRGACNLLAGNQGEGAREWFVLWEGSIRADLSGGFCRDLFNQIVDLGEPINAGMTAAEEVARRTLLPGDIREIRRQHRMEWDGWALTPPKRLEQ
jgi:hypothetical protein